MLMNKISMSQSCLYSIPYQKASKLLQQPFATVGILQ